jgi:hypothetical protein
MCLETNKTYKRWFELGVDRGILLFDLQGSEGCRMKDALVLDTHVIYIFKSTLVGSVLRAIAVPNDIVSGLGETIYRIVTGLVRLPGKLRLYRHRTSVLQWIDLLKMSCKCYSLCYNKGSMVCAVTEPLYSYGHSPQAGL